MDVQNILDVKTVEEPLKHASNEFAILIVYAMNGLGIARQLVLYMTRGLVVNLDQLYQARHCVYTHRHVEFNLSVVDFDCP